MKMRLILGLISKKKKDTVSEFKNIFSSSIKDHRMILLNGVKSYNVNTLDELNVKDLKGSSNICIWYQKDFEKKFFKIFDNESILYDYMVVYGSMWRSNLQSDLKAPKDFSNGNYIIIIKKGSKFKISKDKIGIKQLYYGESPEFIAFSSRKTPLKLLGMDINKLTPGETIELTPKHIKKLSSNALTRPKINIIQPEEALKKYKTSLINAVKKRVNYLKKVGIILSGGIDSSILAKIIKDLNKEIICYCAAKPGSKDYRAAKELTNQYNLPIKLIGLNESNIEKNLPQIISVIEDWNQFQVEEAVPIFFSSQNAAKDGINVVMGGQGPDRLFAGYERYPQILNDGGVEKLNERLWTDLMLGYNEIFERENKIAEFFDQELRLPYYDVDVINTAMSISPRLKTKKDDVVRKYIHRVTGENLHVPLFITWRDKEFACKSSGIHEIIKQIAKKKGYVDEIDYKLKTDVEPDQVISKYIDKHQSSYERIIDNSIQSYFEDIAIDLGMVKVDIINT
jgi:asparagine synthase (glutamine-hydrolysing)